MADVSLRGKVCVVTGGTNGIGRAAALELARRGAEIALVGRDPGRTASVAAAIAQTTGNARVSHLIADLSVQSEVRRVGAELRRRYEEIDVLLNNAGGLFNQRRLSADGIEYTFALNHLGYFLLTHEIAEPLRRAEAARIVNVSSEGHRFGRGDFSSVQSPKGPAGFRTYGESKLANIMFTSELARRLVGTRITANCMHPGIVATGFALNNADVVSLFTRLAQRFMLTPEQGADTAVWLASSLEIAGVSGQYFYKRRRRRPASPALDPEACRQLWQLSERLTGIRSNAGSASA